MEPEFKIWSESNPEIAEKVDPRLGIRNWDELTMEEKEIIRKQFKSNGCFQNEADNYLMRAIINLNNKYKRMCYGSNTLSHGAPHYLRHPDVIDDCCFIQADKDFCNILLREKQDIVYEMITIYADLLISHNTLMWLDRYNEADKKKEVGYAYAQFDAFMFVFNDVMEQFSVNVIMTRTGLTFRQDNKIFECIYEPVLNFLSDTKWEPVNRDLADAFKDYQLKNEQGYSSCVTHTVSALQAYLQIIVHGKTGKGEINSLIIDARKKGLIPNDKFTEQIFKNIEGILMFERQQTADAHPKKEYATEKNSRLVLNLVMVFLQHCIQQ